MPSRGTLRHVKGTEREAVTARTGRNFGLGSPGAESCRTGPPAMAIGHASDSFDEPDDVDQEVAAESAVEPFNESGKGSEQIRRASFGVRPNVRSKASVTRSADSASSRAGCSCSS